jgi:hypothetical protein
MSLEMITISVAFFVAGAVVLWESYKRLHVFHLILDTPTSKVRSIAMGIVEVKGKPYSHEYMVSPYSWNNCVQYAYYIYEYKITDYSKPLTSRKWVKVNSGQHRIPFYVSDNTGSVLVQPMGADLNVRMKKVLFKPHYGYPAKLTFMNKIRRSLYGQYKEFKMTGSGFYEFTPYEKIPFKTYLGDHMVHEHYIGPEDNVYVLGTAMSDDKAHRHMVISRGDVETTFIISNKSEEKLLSEKKAKVFVWYALATILLALGGLVLAMGLITA